MLYVEHSQLKAKYNEAQKHYDAIVSEKEKLFARTQPQGVNVEKERINGGENVNAFDSYLIAKERARLDERLKEIKSILDDRKRLLDLKEKELKASKDWHDIIYKLRYIDNLTITQITNRVSYSRAQIWRILQKIKLHIKAG